MLNSVKMGYQLKQYIILHCMLSLVCGDMYLHNPRGSNNRLDENGRARRNANRMFDSQNNNRGGYNVGSVYYYEGSRIQIEWTNQHSCNGPNTHCEIILQYMCGNTVRDGASTTTIPDNPLQCRNYDCNTDTRYGMNEDMWYYTHCKRRERNKGLFTADQNVGNNAVNTRQNPGGTRRGYECPEERDYYPYWHPTPWKDIAVLTNKATRCPYYEQESENVKARWHCVVPMDLLLQNRNNKRFVIPNNKTECDAWRWPKNEANGTKAVWTESKAHGIDKPTCREGPFTRDNHLGNVFGGNPATFNWTIPDNIRHERCVIRARYNISTNDYEAWDGVNATQNKQKGEDVANIDLSPKYGLSNQDMAEQRGYEFKNNPQIQIFKELDNFKLQLALNTAQYGRTFQDRSHTIAIRKRPDSLKDAVIHNVNVRGKRGNIVQVYPAVEYDFVPNTLEAAEGDYVHFQWTGSNSNPNNNDGQGQAGTDRSNVALQDGPAYTEAAGSWYGGFGKHGHWGRSYPAFVMNNTFLGFSKETMMDLALLTPGQFRGEMSELDDAGTYYDLGPRKITSKGIFHYMCTRNNNFSNRSQKGRIAVKDIVIEQQAIGWNGGNMSLPNGKAAVVVAQGTFSDLHYLRLEEWPQEAGKQRVKDMDRTMPMGENTASNFVVVQPEQDITGNGKTFTVTMDVESSSTNDIVIYRTTSDSFATWTRVEADISNGIASFQSPEGGTFVGVAHTNTGTIVGAVIGVIILVAIIVGGTVFYLRKNPEKMANIKRSFANKV